MEIKDIKNKISEGFFCLAVLTCMLVVWMCFLALVAASLLQEECCTLHHEEALTKAAKQTWQRG